MPILDIEGDRDIGSHKKSKSFAVVVIVINCYLFLLILLNKAQVLASVWRHLVPSRIHKGHPHTNNSFQAPAVNNSLYSHYLATHNHPRGKIGTPHFADKETEADLAQGHREGEKKPGSNPGLGGSSLPSASSLGVCLGVPNSHQI